MRRGLLVASASIAGVLLTLVVYFALFVVQIANADDACESGRWTGSEWSWEGVRDVGFENSYLNLGGRCTYYMDDGSVLIAREPGWWFAETIFGVAALVAGVSAYVARRKGHVGILFSLVTLLAPPLGLLLVATAARRTSQSFLQT